MCKEKQRHYNLDYKTIKDENYETTEKVASLKFMIFFNNQKCIEH